MRLAAGVVLAACLAFGLAACAYSGPRDTFDRLTTRDQGRPYIGMSKAEVLSCAGEPRSRITSGEGTETLTYHYSGAGPVPSAAPKSDEKQKKTIFGSKKKTSDDDNWTCTASFVFENGTLVRVNYAHKDVRSPYDWQKVKNEEKREQMKEEGVPTCNFSLPRCPRS